ncbi:MAG TPA: response regulator [Verrucomicrobiae bacterium]|nr:response regulator [Verrucomicrobiae bacterium]
MIDREVTLLLIEDSPLDAFLIRIELAKTFAQLRLLHAELLRDALSIFHQNSVDMILTDLNLPDSFGVDTVRRLSSEVASTPVIALISNITPQSQNELLQAGATGLIPKDHLRVPAAFAAAVEQALR